MIHPPVAGIFGPPWLQVVGELQTANRNCYIWVIAGLSELLITNF